MNYIINIFLKLNVKINMKDLSCPFYSNQNFLKWIKKIHNFYVDRLRDF